MNNPKKDFFKITFEDLNTAKTFFNNPKHYAEFLYVITEYYQGNLIVARNKIVSRYVAAYKLVMDRVIAAKQTGSKGGLQRVENQLNTNKTLEGSVKGTSTSLQANYQLLNTNYQLLNTKYNIKKEIDKEKDFVETSSTFEDENFKTFENKKNTETKKTGGGEKKQKVESPFMTECKKIFMDWYKQSGFVYVWQPKDDKALGGLVQQIKNIFKEQDKSPPDDITIYKSIEYTLKNLPEWYKKNNNSVTTINSNFNSIRNQIKNGQTNEAIEYKSKSIVDQYYKQK